MIGGCMLPHVLMGKDSLGFGVWDLDVIAPNGYDGLIQDDAQVCIGCIPGQMM